MANLKLYISYLWLIFFYYYFFIFAVYSFAFHKKLNPCVRCLNRELNLSFCSMSVNKAQSCFPANKSWYFCFSSSCQYINAIH